MLVANQTHVTKMKQRHSRYFHDSDIQSSKQQVWTSCKSFQDSMQAYNSKLKTEDQRRLLAERKTKLKVLLDNEKEQLEQELLEHTPNQVTLMKERAMQLKSKREKERKQIVKQKLHDQWKNNCPAVRELESQHLQQFVLNQWESQIQQKQQETELMEKEKQRCEVLLEEEHLAALRLEDEHRKQQRIREDIHAKMLKQQMAEIKQREEEAILLEQQQTLLVQRQIQLENTEEQLEKLKEEQRKSSLGRVLLHQHKAQMKRKSQQIQEELELDMKLLTDMAEKEKVDQMLHTARREKAKADVEWMKQVVMDQLKVEKERESELDLLYQEEVAKMWHKREAEWEREKVAREKLIAEVIAERQHQIRRKMDYLKSQQAESIQHREELLREMESFAKHNIQQAKQKQKKHVKTAEELKEQIQEREIRKKLAQLQCKTEVEAQRYAEEDYEALLQEEETRMTERRLKPKVHTKKKFAWY